MMKNKSTAVDRWPANPPAVSVDSRVLARVLVDGFVKFSQNALRIKKAVAVRARVQAARRY